jgi:hypothetical protein
VCFGLSVVQWIRWDFLLAVQIGQNLLATQQRIDWSASVHLQADLTTVNWWGANRPERLAALQTRDYQS